MRKVLKKILFISIMAIFLECGLEGSTLWVKAGQEWDLSLLSGQEDKRPCLSESVVEHRYYGPTFEDGYESIEVTKRKIGENYWRYTRWVNPEKEKSYITDLVMLSDAEKSGDCGDLDVPQSIDGSEVIEVRFIGQEYNESSRCVKFGKITIPSTVQYIAPRAFSNVYMKEVYFEAPENIKAVGEYAFFCNFSDIYRMKTYCKW